MNNFYIGSVTAFKYTAVGQMLNHFPIAVVASSVDEATGKMMRLSKERNPLSEGWQGHNVNLSEIPFVMLESWFYAAQRISEVDSPDAPGAVSSES